MIALMERVLTELNLSYFTFYLSGNIKIENNFINTYVRSRELICVLLRRIGQIVISTIYVVPLKGELWVS